MGEGASIPSRSAKMMIFINKPEYGPTTSCARGYMKKMSLITQFESALLVLARLPVALNQPKNGKSSHRI